MTDIADATGARDEGLRDRIAQIIDPRAFKEWDSLYRLGISQGDDDKTAKRCAELCYGPDRDRAILSKQIEPYALDQRPFDEASAP